MFFMLQTNSTVCLVELYTQKPVANTFNNAIYDTNMHLL